MTDTPTPVPSPSKAMKSAVVIALGMFLIFGGAALGWHAGSALARLMGL
jgi:hypothetical protein